MKTKKVKKKKIKWKVLLRFSLFLFFVYLSYLYVANLPTKNILIKGTTFLSDYEIISAIDYQDYPNLFGVSKKELTDKILALDFVNHVKIRRSLTGILTIEVEEANPLFLNRNNNKVVLENKKEIASDKIYGIPILINYVPDSYYNKLIEKFKNVDKNVRNLISEMEYQPWKSNDVMIDETRFFLRMNDGNSVYVNLLHLDKLNNYIEIYASLEGKSGILYLDSSSDKISFSEYK